MFALLATIGVIALGASTSVDAARIPVKRIPGTIPVQSTSTRASYWKYDHCQWDPQGALSTYSFTSAAMTVDLCTATCQGRNAPWAAVEFGTTCWCGTSASYGGGGYPIAVADCQYTACPGAPAVSCGGVTAALVYVPDTTAIASASQSASLSASNAASLSASRSQSVSASNAASLSLSQSISQSAYNAASTSSAASLSASQALSQSIYNAASASNAASLSASQALSQSIYNAASASNAASLAASLSASQSVYAAASASTASSLAASQSIYNAASASRAASLSASQSVYAAASASAAASLALSQSIYNASIAASQSVYAAASASNAASLSVSQSISASLSSSIAASAAASASVSASLSASISASVSASAAAALATTIPSPFVAASVSCIAEGTAGRALTGSFLASPSMTLNQCLTFCASGNFALAGVEYGTECRCSNALNNGASLNLPSTQCNMPCGGSAVTTCGGPNAMNLYVIPSKIANLASDLTVKAATLPSGWSAASTTCVAEASSGRALSGASTSSSDMTISKCISYCAGQGFGIAGIEFSTQCFCSNSYDNGASLSKASNQCNMFCGGDSNAICGGPNALSVYTNPALIPVVASIPTTSLPTGWSSTACIQEVNNRALTGPSFSSPSMTVPTCLNYCQSKGFGYAGVEYASECYCSNSLSNGASVSITSNQCNMPCSGDATSICGGPSALQLYTNPANLPTVAAAPVNPTTVNGFTQRGCVQEVAGRALTGLRKDDPQMTIETCTAICQSAGFSLAGVEYQTECYCGNAFSNGGSLSLLSGQCNMPCPGNSSETCGGPNALQIYQVGN